MKGFVNEKKSLEPKVKRVIPLKDLGYVQYLKFLKLNGGRWIILTGAVIWLVIDLLYVLSVASGWIAKPVLYGVLFIFISLLLCALGADLSRKRKKRGGSD